MSNNAPIRLLIVDDSMFMRRAVRSMLEGAPDILVIGEARNGVDAVKEAQRLKPDAITLDIEMPEMDGLTALRQIRQFSDAAVLMLSSLTTEGSRAALTAMRYGASDFIAKAASQVSLDVLKIENQLVEKIRQIVQTRRMRAAFKDAPPPSDHDAQLALKASDFDVLVIGSSTGGPPVLETIFKALPARIGMPLVVAQHMPATFTQSMAERLDELCAFTVLHGVNDMTIQPNRAYIIQGGQHGRILGSPARGLRLEVNKKPESELYHPSANELFRSAAKIFNQRVLAVVLTGMGDDGLEGARVLHDLGATILAQDQASCVVYGMPKVVTQDGLVAASLNPTQLAKVLADMFATQTAVTH